MQLCFFWNFKDRSKNSIVAMKKVTSSGQEFAVSMALLDSCTLAVSSSLHINIYDTQKWKCIRKLCGHSDMVYDVKCLDNEKFLLLSAGKDKVCKLWNYKSGVCLRTYVGHSCMVNNILVLSKYLFASASNEIKFWHVDQEDCIVTINKTRHDSIYTLCKLSKDMIVSGGSENTIKIWKY